MISLDYKTAVPAHSDESSCPDKLWIVMLCIESLELHERQKAYDVTRNPEEKVVVTCEKVVVVVDLDQLWIVMQCIEGLELQ